MRKIKDKIIKMLGGVPKKEFAKEIEIAHKQGAACGYSTIEEYIINHRYGFNNECSTLLSSTRLYINKMYRKAMNEIHELKNS